MTERLSSHTQWREWVCMFRFFLRVKYTSVGAKLRERISAQCEEGFPDVAGQGWNGIYGGHCQGKAGQASGGDKMEKFHT